MNQILEVMFEQLKSAKIQINQKALRKQVNLFDIEPGPEISFNGYKSPNEYQSFLDGFYSNCKTSINKKLSTEETCFNKLKKEFDMSRFEVKEFKSRYFPKNNHQTVFNRIELIKASQFHLTDEEILKKKFLVILKFKDISLN